MRPLYIDGQEGTWVKLDMPALKVTCADRADLLFPLQRISRVVVTGSVCWDTDALLACADQGIAVAFLSDDGELRGRWLGKGGERQTFIQRLADLMTRPDGVELYEDWYDAMERMVVGSAAGKLLRDKQQTVTESELRAFFDYQRQALPVLASDRIYAAVRGLLSAQLVQLFQNIGLDAKSELLQERWLDLPNDFAGLLFWDLEIPLLNWLENLDGAPNQQEIVAFYERRSERIIRLSRGLLNKLHSWLVDLY
ncbi:MAG: CRISPR-associated endonuclease Cas1 [Methylococcaceae bacterium]